MEGDGIEREEMLFDLRRINPKIHVLVLWVNRSVVNFLERDDISLASLAKLTRHCLYISFKAPLGAMLVNEISVTLTNFIFAETTRPGEFMPHLF